MLYFSYFSCLLWPLKRAKVQNSVSIQPYLQSRLNHLGPCNSLTKGCSILDCFSLQCLQDLSPFWTCYVMRNFGTYFTGTYLRVSPGTTRKCMLHDSVRCQNNRSRDPISLLSMDIVVETFLEISVSGLLVLTQRLQDPFYMEV
jgi:hypothetical protein